MLRLYAGFIDVAASPTCAASCLPQAQKRLFWARRPGGLERSDRIKRAVACYGSTLNASLDSNFWALSGP